MKSNKFWLLILGGIVVLSAVAAMLLGHVQSSYALIYKDNVLTDTVNLSSVIEPYNIDVLGSGGVNILKIERGRIRMSRANCPDRICVRQGWKSGGITPIVCLPNRVVVTFDGIGSGVDIDAVVG